jgi:hypothetical protein
VYPEEEILEQKYRLLSKTHMVDFCADVYKQWRRVSSPPDGNWHMLELYLSFSFF